MCLETTKIKKIEIGTFPFIKINVQWKNNVRVQFSNAKIKIWNLFISIKMLFLEIMVFLTFKKTHKRIDSFNCKSLGNYFYVEYP